MALVLVDSSVWIDFLRYPKSSHAPVLKKLVRFNQARITEVVRVELLSGTRNEPEYRLLEERLTSIPVLTEPNDFWNQIAQARFRLARQGIQSAIPDVAIAVMAKSCHCALWSRDNLFGPISKILRFRLYFPPR